MTLEINTEAETNIDPILVTVIQRKLHTIAEEMAITLLRSTRSPLLNQAGDLGTGVFDAEGRILAGAEYIPIIALSLRMACESVREFFGDDIHPGDVILHNDVFAGGLQNNDTGVIVPVFYKEELVGWVGCKGHLVDIGGPVRGGCNPLATEVWQEALRIPPVKVYEQGKFREDVWNLIFANIRLREVVEADMQAQIGACQVGESEMVTLIEQSGLEAFQTHSDALLNATERMMRKAIKAIPDGTYKGESVVNVDAGGTLHQYPVRVAITVRDDEIWLDYTGTAPQASGYTNAPIASSASATLMALLMLVDPDMPHNDGMLRPVHINIPKGTILNCDFPAATFYGNFMSVQNTEAIMRAMADAIPDRVSAPWNRPYVLRTAGYDPKTGNWYHDIHFLGIKGGGGATHGVDGYNQAAPIFAPALKTHDYELNEVQEPHFILKHEYLTDSGGPGKWRGGLGVDYQIRIDAESITAVTQGDGIHEGAAGLRGGSPGVVNYMELESSAGEVYHPLAMEIIPQLSSGVTVRQQTGGGGGFGNPLERDIEAVREDVQKGIVSEQSAREDYGVILKRHDNRVSVDKEATIKQRERLHQKKRSKD